jgi:CRP/FNR family cyclic AMP-dependent transcriptional regulator
MLTGALGQVFKDGEVIVRRGDEGDCMYVIQQGRVEVIAEEGGREVRLRLLESGDFFGEMAIFERKRRSATVRALGEVRVLSVDRKNFLRRIHEDPSLAFRIVQTMSQRMRGLIDEVLRLSAQTKA